MQKAIQNSQLRAVLVVCDLSNMESVRHAAEETVAMKLPIVGLLNNAGINNLAEMLMLIRKNAFLLLR